MAELKTFAQLGIKVKYKKLVGEKIRLHKVLETPMIVHTYVIKPSKYPDKSDRCLYLQFSINDKMHVAFSTAKLLMETLEKIHEDDFPFSATITNKNEIYEFI